MTYNAVMLDLETLSTKNDAMVVSIGAVAFSTELFKVCPDGFYKVINLEGATGHIDTDTLCWWMRQSDEARAVFTAEDRVFESVALLDFNQWIHDTIAVLNIRNLTVWGNGSSFDNVILRNLYQRTGIIEPWAWYNDRCYRTYMRACENALSDGTRSFRGVKHNALDDARHQAESLVEVMDAVKSRLS